MLDSIADAYCSLVLNVVFCLAPGLAESTAVYYEPLPPVITAEVAVARCVAARRNPHDGKSRMHPAITCLVANGESVLKPLLAVYLASDDESVRCYCVEVSERIVMNAVEADMDFDHSTPTLEEWDTHEEAWQREASRQLSRAVPADAKSMDPRAAYVAMLRNWLAHRQSTENVRRLIRIASRVARTVAVAVRSNSGRKPEFATAG